MDPYFQSDDIKLTDLLRGIKNYFLYVIKRVYIVIAATILMYYGGRWFADNSEKLWVSNSSFNAIDARSGGGFGGLMSLASSFAGIGGGTSNDILSGIYSSRNVFKTSMLEEVEIDGKKDKIINFYLQSVGYLDEYNATPGLENFKFTSNDMYTLTHHEDSIMTGVYETFIEDFLEIEFDPLTGLIKSGVFTPERMISMKLAEALLRNTNQYYAFGSNEKAKDGYEKMRKRVDSIAGAINYYNGLIAFTKDQNIFNRKQEGVEKLNEYSREITILNIQYNDAVSSLEAAKGALNNQSQVMRIVDQPAFSTELDQRDPDFWGLIGLAVGSVLSIIILCFVKASKDSFEEEKLEKEKSNTSFS
ncbi:MAG TPA: hypothetical protein VLZ75_01065 [Chitinophagales bacterium]|nr:hypothetical protein [Chitinophagales bacterium]